jgi:hypothetical protein
MADENNINVVSSASTGFSFSFQQWLALDDPFVQRNKKQESIIWFQHSEGVNYSEKY